eukprot:SAG31_NODE_2030_length_6628_cov_1.729514_1_plen_1507_part_00
MSSIQSHCRPSPSPPPRAVAHTPLPPAEDAAPTTRLNPHDEYDIAEEKFRFTKAAAPQLAHMSVDDVVEAFRGMRLGKYEGALRQYQLDGPKWITMLSGKKFPSVCWESLFRLIGGQKIELTRYEREELMVWYQAGTPTRKARTGKHAGDRLYNAANQRAANVENKRQAAKKGQLVPPSKDSGFTNGSTYDKDGAKKKKRNKKRNKTTSGKKLAKKLTAADILPHTDPKSPVKYANALGQQLDGKTILEWCSAADGSGSAAARQLNQLFTTMDVHSCGSLTLVDLDKAIFDMPELADLQHKPSLIRAFEAVITRPRHEPAAAIGPGTDFRLLLHYVGYFRRRAAEFDAVKTDQDHCIGLTEFIQACALVGHTLTTAQAREEFAHLVALSGTTNGQNDEDTNTSVPFEAFCTWCAHKHTDTSTYKHSEATEVLKEVSSRAAIIPEVDWISDPEVVDGNNSITIPVAASSQISRKISVLKSMLSSSDSSEDNSNAASSDSNDGGNEDKIVQPTTDSSVNDSSFATAASGNPTDVNRTDVTPTDVNPTDVTPTDVTDPIKTNAELSIGEQLVGGATTVEQAERWLRLADRYTSIEAWGQAAMHWSLVAAAIDSCVLDSGASKKVDQRLRDGGQTARIELASTIRCYEAGNAGTWEDWAQKFLLPHQQSTASRDANHIAPKAQIPDKSMRTKKRAARQHAHVRLTSPAARQNPASENSDAPAQILNLAEPGIPLTHRNTMSASREHQSIPTTVSSPAKTDRSTVLSGSGVTSQQKEQNSRLQKQCGMVQKENRRLKKRLGEVTELARQLQAAANGDHKAATAAEETIATGVLEECVKARVSSCIESPRRRGSQAQTSLTRHSPGSPRSLATRMVAANCPFAPQTARPLGNVHADARQRGWAARNASPPKAHAWSAAVHSVIATRKIQSLGVHERHDQWVQQKAREREELRQKLLAAELADCSFVPKTNTSGQVAALAGPVHRRLQEAAVASRNRLRERAESILRAEDERVAATKYVQGNSTRSKRRSAAGQAAALVRLVSPPRHHQAIMNAKLRTVDAMARGVGNKEERDAPTGEWTPNPNFKPAGNSPTRRSSMSSENHGGTPSHQDKSMPKMEQKKDAVREGKTVASRATGSEVPERLKVDSAPDIMVGPAASVDVDALFAARGVPMELLSSVAADTGLPEDSGRTSPKLNLSSMRTSPERWLDNAEAVLNEEIAEAASQLRDSKLSSSTTLTVPSTGKSSEAAASAVQQERSSEPEQQQNLSQSRRGRRRQQAAAAAATVAITPPRLAQEDSNEIDGSPGKRVLDKLAKFTAVGTRHASVAPNSAQVERASGSINEGGEDQVGTNNDIAAAVAAAAVIADDAETALQKETAALERDIAHSNATLTIDENLRMAVTGESEVQPPMTTSSNASIAPPPNVDPLYADLEAMYSTTSGARLSSPLENNWHVGLQDHTTSTTEVDPFSDLMELLGPSASIGSASSPTEEQAVDELEEPDGVADEDSSSLESF